MNLTLEQKRNSVHRGKINNKKAKAKEKHKSSVVVLWTSLIRGYVENGEDKDAQNYVQLMQD